MSKAILTGSSDNPYEALAHAIIVQACDDYRNSYRRISHSEPIRDSEWLIGDALRFFGESWYVELTGVDSDYLVKHLRMDVVETAREDYRDAWRQVWQKGKRKKLDDVGALERFFKTDRFGRLSGLSGRRVIAEEQKAVVTEMLRRYWELKGKGTLAADRELERIRAFMRSKDFGRLSDLNPEELIRIME